MDPNEYIPPEPYFEGLRTADDGVLAELYAKFQAPIVRSITAMGGSAAAGNVFFQTALVEAARAVRAGTIPEGVLFYDYLKALALHHFRDWLFEREQELPHLELDPADLELQAAMPTEAQMRDTRRNILAWRRPAEASGETTDPEGQLLFQKLRGIERRIDDGALPSRSTRGANRVLTYGVVFLICALLGYFIYLRVTRAQTPAEVYKSNFNPPESIVADIQTRNNANPQLDSNGVYSNACLERLGYADTYYREKEYQLAAEALSEILDDTTTLCHSDAYFYLGIIGLQLDKPNATLQFFSKIEDLERYGEDLYWYQALAFVKLAALDPTLREKAAGALERARSNTQHPERREQAEKMLQELDH